MNIVNTQWFMNAAEPLIYALDWFEDGSCQFRWEYHKSQGLPVVLPRRSRPILVVNNDTHITPTACCTQNGAETV